MWRPAFTWVVESWHATLEEAEEAMRIGVRRSAGGQGGGAEGRRGGLPMRTIATIAALLAVCLLAPAAADAEAKAEQEAGANGDDVKVLGFTFGKPPPKEAVLEEEAGRARGKERLRWARAMMYENDDAAVDAAIAERENAEGEDF